MNSRTVTASLLDRLLDDEDSNPSFPPGQTSEASYIASVARDIEQLLNTRNVRKQIIHNGEPHIAAPVTLVDSSIVMLGLPDFSALSLSNGRHRQALVDSVKATVETFDKRLKDVQVVLPDDAKASTLLQFSIRACLEIVGFAKDVGFEAWFHSATLRFAVSPSKGRCGTHG